MRYNKRKPTLSIASQTGEDSSSQLKRRGKNDHSESDLQIACVKWFKYQYPGIMIFAIPNGGKRGIITASIMKREGVLAGVPDIFIPALKLFIEMKTETGKLSANQKNVISDLLSIGYHVEVCRTFDEFKGAVIAYLNKTRKFNEF